MQIQRQSIEAHIPNTKLTVMIMGVLLLAAGIAVLASPGRVTILLTQIVGVAVVLAGAATLVPSIIRFGGITKTPPGDLVLGGAQLLFGLLVMLLPSFFVRFLITLLGIVIVATGLADLWRANETRRLGIFDWKPEMVIGAVTLVAGVLVAIAPFAFATVATVCGGIVLVADGLSELYLGWKML